MKKTLVPAFAVVAAALLTGCAPTSVQTYVVHFASIARYREGLKPSFDKVGDSFTGHPRELTPLPGRYLVLTYRSSAAGSGPSRARPAAARRARSRPAPARTRA